MYRIFDKEDRSLLAVMKYLLHMIPPIDCLDRQWRTVLKTGK